MLLLFIFYCCCLFITSKFWRETVAFEIRETVGRFGGKPSAFKMGGNRWSFWRETVGVRHSWTLWLYIKYIYIYIYIYNNHGFVYIKPRYCAIPPRHCAIPPTPPALWRPFRTRGVASRPSPHRKPRFVAPPSPPRVIPHSDVTRQGISQKPRFVAPPSLPHVILHSDVTRQGIFQNEARLRRHYHVTLPTIPCDLGRHGDAS